MFNFDREDIIIFFQSTLITASVVAWIYSAFYLVAYGVNQGFIPIYDDSDIEIKPLSESTKLIKENEAILDREKIKAYKILNTKCKLYEANHLEIKEAEEAKEFYCKLLFAIYDVDTTSKEWQEVIKE